MGCSASRAVKVASSPPSGQETEGSDQSVAKQIKETSRRLSMAGGPAQKGASDKPLAASEDARRRRLSVATAPAAETRAIVAENAAALSHLTAGDLNIPVVRSATSAALPLHWGEYSRPGNDPMKAVKENQDSLVVLDGYGGRSDQMFFGVFDGHGPAGALASAFCKKRVPEAWLEGGDLVSDTFQAINRGCISVNQELHISAVDVYMSGTTAIMSLLRGSKLYIANVGDSRAVLGRLSSSGVIKAIELSTDQKPDRPDEHARILACGGRVFEWGVSRVWLRDADIPGLAMSRSFGDIAAETVGVFAEPELAEVTLGKSDRFIIWASDGVWEFITSQEAADIVAPYLDKSPIEAAAALVRESTRRWNLEEDVVDDTTAVIAFLNF